MLNPPISLIAFLIFLYFSLGLAVWAAFDYLQALVTMILLLATLPFIWRSLRMVIMIDGSELRIDKAHIELKYLKTPVSIDEKEYRLLRTTKLDARSFHATRAWLKRGVKVELNDERDRTNYWLIGCKQNEVLAAELVKRIPYRSH